MKPSHMPLCSEWWQCPHQGHRCEPQQMTASRPRCRRALQNGGNFAVAANGGKVRDAAVCRKCSESPLRAQSDRCCAPFERKQCGTIRTFGECALRVFLTLLRRSSVGFRANEHAKPLLPKGPTRLLLVPFSGDSPGRNRQAKYDHLDR